jgi:hypothetical protein
MSNAAGALRFFYNAARRLLLTESQMQTQNTYVSDWPRCYQRELCNLLAQK